MSANTAIFTSAGFLSKLVFSLPDMMLIVIIITQSIILYLIILLYFYGEHNF